MKPSHKIGWKKQFVQWNAGLRGAVAFLLITSNEIPSLEKDLITATVRSSVIFGIIFHGLLTAPIVKLCGLTQLTQPNDVKIKTGIHSIWSRLDKNYIIPLISNPRPSGDENNENQNTNEENTNNEEFPIDYELIE